MPEHSMNEKRLDKRHRKQISVRFGEESPDHIGLALDVSSTGIFLKSSRIYPQQTKLVVSMKVADGNITQCEGVVQWAKRIHPAIAPVMPKNGMGVLLTNTTEEYIKFINSHGRF